MMFQYNMMHIRTSNDPIENIKILILMLAIIPTILYLVWAMKRTIKSFLQNKKEVK